MTAASTSLLFLGGAFALGGVGSAIYWAFRGDLGSVARPLAAYEVCLERQTSFIMLRYTGRQIVRAQAIAICFGVALWLATQSSLYCLWVLIASVGPPGFVARRRQSRVAQLERQLDTWLLMLANALKATSSVGEAIASTVNLVPRPFSEELDLLVKELRLGVPVDRALDALAGRINSTVVSGALATIVVARQTGGDLSSTLEQSSAALRESARLEGVLQAKTAEGRGQVVVLASVPFVLCVIIAWLDGTWFDPMLSHHYGRALLVGCSLAWAIASFWAYQIVQVDL